MTEKRPGFWVRFIAKFLDSLIISIPVSFLLFALFRGDGEDLRDFIQSALLVGYEIYLLISWNGQTIGKRVMGIRVVRMTNDPIDIYTATVRQFLVMVLYGLTFGILILISVGMVVFREDKRSIHDLVAGTEVLYWK